MKISSVWLMSLLTGVLFIIVDLASGVILPVKQSGVPYTMIWMIAANAVVAVTAGLLASRAPWRGFRLALALAAIPLTVQVINVVEGVVYLKTDTAVLWSLAFSPLKYVLMVPLWFMVFRPLANPPSAESVIPARTFGGKLWRLILCDFLYVFLYLTAGAIIYPMVRDFYATQPMPSLGLIIALQLLLRGPLFAGICVLIARMVGAQRLATALIVGLAFTLISGVAPLIVPSSFFPDAVRWVHFCEVTSSNFAFGVLVSWIWSRKSPVQNLAAATA